MTAKKKTQNNKQQPEFLPLSHSDVVEALQYALGAPNDPAGSTRLHLFYYTGDAYVTVTVSKAAMEDDPREP